MQATSADAMENSTHHALRRVWACVPKGWTWIAVAAAAIVVLHQIALVGDFRVDDAYITFSFSKNMAEGNGPVYSHGLRVEGYSNFLWMMLTAFGLWITQATDPYPIARTLGIVSVLATAGLVYRCVWRASGTWPGLLAAGFVLCCTDLFRAALSGLETAFFIAALTWGWCTYLQERWPKRRWSLLAFVPVALTRIDGFVPVLAVIAFEFLIALHEERFTYRRFLLWAGPAVAIWAIYFAWRWHYYGLPLPTTYYAKSMATARDPTRGIHIFRYFLDDYAVWSLMPLVAGALIWAPRGRVLALLLAMGVQCVYSVHVGGDWMPFHRFFIATVPLLAILCGWGIKRIWDHVGPMHLILRWPVRGAALFCLGMVALRMHAASIDSGAERAKLADAARTIVHTRDNLRRNVDLLRLMLRRPGERLATDYAGVFAVETDAEIIDMWGLCNADIALRGGMDGINPEYGKECSSCYAYLLPDYFHVIVPIVRDPEAFATKDQVIGDIFQGSAIDKVIDLRQNYAVGRVVEERTRRTLWFLERKRSGLPRVTRTVAPNVHVDYPFE